MRQNSFKNSWLRRGGAAALAAVLALSLAGCGSEGGDETPKKEWAYVPEFITIEEENVSYWDMKIEGDSLYYSSYVWDEENQSDYECICRYSITDRKMTQVILTWPEDVVGGRGINNFSIGGDGCYYVTNSVYNEEAQNSISYLHKFDKDGNYVYGIELKDSEGGDFWIQEMAADSQGRLCINSGRSVFLYDEGGKVKGTLSLGAAETYIERMAQGAEGKVFVLYSSYNGDTSSTQMAEVDFDGGKTGKVYENFPGNVRSLVPGTEGSFLLNDGSKVYEYSAETQKKTELFDWLDCDINGNYVENFGQMADGRLVAVIQDWETNDNEVALLSRVKASEVAQKENITIGTISGGYMLRSLAVRFNKASDKYHVSVKEYLNYDNMNENSYADAITSLNNDITSSNCPDLIDLSSLNVSQLASKGAFDNLNDYLEKSSVIKRADFMENILDAYTYDGSLVSIPTSFTLQTLMGHKSQIGDKKGWTLDEMIAYADANPDKELFDRVAKGEILQGLIMLNEESFMDWDTGECNFDSDQFKALLTFVNRFPDEVDWDDDKPVTPIRIQNGEVLLDMVGIYEFNSIQESLEMFKGDAVCIGYPTADGSSGHAFQGREAYAIASKAKCKEGAWAFIESVLTQEPTRWNRSGFPTLRARLEAEAEEAVKIEYVLDENGEPYLDENGEPVIANTGGGIGWGDWFYEYHVPTQEEVDMVMEVMKGAKPLNYNGDSEIMTIILEESEPFFKGQKSIDEVTGIIQNRVSIYVSENR